MKKKKRNWTETQQRIWIDLLDDLKRWSIPSWVYEMRRLGLDVRRDMYGDYPGEERTMSLSKYPFETGTLMKVRPCKPYKGSVDVQLWDRVYDKVSHRRNVYDDPRRVPGWGYWTVIDRHNVRGAGWWHKIVRGDGEMGWVEDLQKEFVVVQSEQEKK